MAKDTLDEDTQKNYIELTAEEAEELQDFLLNPIDEEGKRDYLERLLPELSSEDMEIAIVYIYRCRSCRRYFPTWWIPKENWEASIWGKLERICALDETVREVKITADGNWGLQICKDCFEATVDPAPKCFTIDEYITKRLMAESGLEEKDIEKYRRVLGLIWDLPPSE